MKLGEFVGSLYDLLVPVGPVEVVAEQGEAEGVRDGVIDDDAPVAAVGVGDLDAVHLGVAPVEHVLLHVKGQAVGPGDVLKRTKGPGQNCSQLFSTSFFRSAKIL